MKNKELLVEKHYNPDYDKAFRKYIRYGTPINVPYYLLVTKSAPGVVAKFYIWRTMQDLKVRPAHAFNNGKVFDWKEPPPTGHPGKAYGCRCWAEEIAATFDTAMESFIDMYDVTTLAESTN